ncbi:50S ribosomal protein L35 [Patescibacteria group bacterium]|nr:50S ribosomal protein L35 [Patescibacteria group bacterium]
MKTNKSFSKRIKVTKNGKIVTRRPGQGHFNAKESGSTSMKKKRSTVITLSQKVKRQFLPRTGKNS